MKKYLQKNEKQQLRSHNGGELRAHRNTYACVIVFVQTVNHPEQKKKMDDVIDSIREKVSFPI